MMMPETKPRGIKGYKSLALSTLEDNFRLIKALDTLLKSLNGVAINPTAKFNEVQKNVKSGVELLKELDGKMEKK